MATLPENDRLTGPLIAAAGQTLFDADFPLIDAPGDPAGTSVMLRRERPDGDAVLALGDFEISAVSEDGFVVQLADPALAGDRYWIVGRQRMARLRAHPDGGAVRTPTLESDAREAAARDQELARDLGRAVLVPIGEAGLQLPSAEERRGRLWLWEDSDPAPPSLLSIDDAAELFKGDPGGNAMAVGLFIALPGLAIPDGTDLIQTSGHSQLGYGIARYKAVAAGPATAWRVQTSNGRWFELAADDQGVSAAVFGLHPDATAATNTTAIQTAMAYMLQRWPLDSNYYPGGPGDPTDFYGVNRQSGRILIPGGRFRVLPNVFSDPALPRAPWCGFDFQGEGKMTSILLLETSGVDSWFYKNSAATPNQFQNIHFRDLGFRSDNWAKGNMAFIWSAGGPKQFRWTDCDFRNLKQFMETDGTGNADLTKVTRCTGHFYGDILTLNNGQSVQHDFIGSDLGTYGNMVRVKLRGGGNVNFTDSSVDLTWHEDYSPAAGSAMYWENDDASVGQGNCTFSWQNCRVEVESYTRSAGDKPLRIVRTAAHPNTAIPRIKFENVNFVNGKTYTINAGGSIVSGEYRRMTAVELHPRKHITFEDCVLLKCFFYLVDGSNSTGSPNQGGILRFTRCMDGILGELPPADATKGNLHARVTYVGSAGRVITEGMVDHTTGSPFIRQMLNADPHWNRAVGRDPEASLKVTNFKHFNNGWPFTANAGNDHYIDLAPGVDAQRIHILKPASGSSTSPYRLLLGSDDKSVVLATSVLGVASGLHVIDLGFVDLSAFTRLRLWADDGLGGGTGTVFSNGGFAFIQHF